MYDLDAQRDALRQLRKQARFGNGVKVAVLDGAIDPTHPDLVAHQIEPEAHGNRTMHGTAVASIIAGKKIGVAPSAEILPFSVFEEDQNGTLRGCSERILAKAIKSAVEAGAHIINVSGAHLTNTGQPSDEMRAAIDACVEANVLLIAAVGNNGLEVDTVPACVRQVLAVGAHDINGHAAAFNNVGPLLCKKMLLAPGVDIRFFDENRNSSISGSSFSAPVVSGIVALMRSIDPMMTPETIQNLFVQSCVPCQPSHTGDDKSAIARRLDLVQLHENLRPIEAASVTPPIHTSERNLTMSDPDTLPEMVTPAGETDIKDAVLPAATEEPVEASIDFAAGLDIQPPVMPEPTPIQDPAPHNFVHANPVEVQPSGVTSNLIADEKVFAFGTVGYDFVNETNRDYFQQLMSNVVRNDPNVDSMFPNDHLDMARLLRRPEFANAATALEWTLKIDGIDCFAIRPQNQFAILEFSQLVNFLVQQEGATPEVLDNPEMTTETKLKLRKEKTVDNPNLIDRVSLAGSIVGETRLYNGHVVPVISPILRGMFSWNSAALAEANVKSKSAAGAQKEKDALRNFLDRVYYELRNKSVEPYHRALNYAATNAFTAGEVFADSLDSKLELNKIMVERSPISRPGSDFWDVVMEFFNPQKREEEARKLYRYTIDVSGLMPVTFGPLRQWRAY